VENDSVDEIDFLGLVLRTGGAVANLDQIPAILRKKGFNVAATTMDRWFSRAMGDPSPVDDILTVKWAEGFSQFNDAVTLIKGRATSSNAATELKSKLNANGLLVTGATFDHTVGKASAQDKYYYQSAAITKHTEDDFGFAVGATNIHMVAKGSVSGTNICVSEVGYYLIDPYRFNEPENQRLGVWDFNEMDYEGYLETYTSSGEFRIFNSDFVDWSLKNRKGADFNNYSDIKTYSLSSPWVIPR
jgi:hypothetical protein